MEVFLESSSMASQSPLYLETEKPLKILIKINPLIHQKKIFYYAKTIYRMWILYKGYLAFTKQIR
jgi:hypothetical protein